MMQDTECLGEVFPKGTVLSVPSYSIHHLEEVWGDPFTYRPERWIEDPRKEEYEKALNIFSYGRSRPVPPCPVQQLIDILLRPSRLCRPQRCLHGAASVHGDLDVQIRLQAFKPGPGARGRRRIFAQTARMQDGHQAKESFISLQDVNRPLMQHSRQKIFATDPLKCLARPITTRDDASSTSVMFIASRQSLSPCERVNLLTRHLASGRVEQTVNVFDRLCFVE